MVSAAPQSTFVPATLNAAEFASVEPLLKALLARPVNSARELEQWLIDRGELAAACSEVKANMYITMTCDTDDQAASQAFEKYIVEVEPKLKPYAFELDKRFVELAAEFPLDPARFTVVVRDAKAEVELFREENIPLETELAQLGQKFEQLAGSLTVQFDGREQTLPQMARYQEQTDRTVREAAWRATAERRAKEVGGFNDIYDQMIALRTKVAKNAGFKDYVAYAYKAKHRFDYTEKHCRDFHDGVEKAIVPLVRALDRERAQKLGVEPLRPWDLSVDVKGRGPLRPFSGGRELMSKSVAAMQSLDPRLATMLASMGDGAESRGARDGACLDLDSRKGKAPGGYQYMRDRSRKAFIFMNAAGLHKDVETMVHEAGHAFHSMLSQEEPLLEYRQQPDRVRRGGEHEHGAAEHAAPGRARELLPQQPDGLCTGDAGAAQAQRAHPAVDRDDRRVPARGVREPEPHEGGARAALAEPGPAVRQRRVVERHRAAPGQSVAAAVAPLQPPVLLHRVRHRAARRTAALAHQPGAG